MPQEVDTFDQLLTGLEHEHRRLLNVIDALTQENLRLSVKVAPSPDHGGASSETEHQRRPKKVTVTFEGDTKTELDLDVKSQGPQVPVVSQKHVGLCVAEDDIVSLSDDSYTTDSDIDLAMLGMSTGTFSEPLAQVKENISDMLRWRDFSGHIDLDPSHHSLDRKRISSRPSSRPSSRVSKFSAISAVSHASSNRSSFQLHLSRFFRHKSVQDVLNDALTTYAEEALDASASCATLPVPEMWPHWSQRPQKGRSGSRAHTTHMMSLSKFLREDGTKEFRTGELLADDSVVGKCFVLRPGSYSSLFWNTGRVLMLASDFLYVPLLVFEWPRTFFVDLITTCFWTLDVFVSFFAGFYTNGLVEMRWRHTVHRYFVTYFFTDLAILAADWAIAVLQLTNPSRRDTSDIDLVRIVRLLRFVRIVRLFRLRRHSMELSTPPVFKRSQLVMSLTKICKMTMIVIAMNHYIACGWVYVGKNTVESWLSKWRAKRATEGDDLAVYTTALHWSLTQFTPAAMDVVAGNTIESIYSICTIVFAFMTFSSFVSSITALMQNLRKMRTQREIQEHNLRRYFIDHDISADLGSRITRFLTKTYFPHTSRTHENDLKTLELLPSFLKNELREELHTPIVVRMPFMQTLKELDAATLQKICHTAVQQHTFLSEESVFEVAAVAEKVLFFVGGFADYIHKKDVLTVQARSGRISKMSQTLRSPCWVGDPVLWLQWVHQGHLIAKTLLDVTVLTASDFQCTLSNVRPSWSYAQTYARLFRMYLQKGGDWDTDVWYDSPMMSDIARAAANPKCTESIDKFSV